ncbi:response regulator transcription factor [Pantoea ananatis]|nr:response regulator transcription factor [Pantoea ananatis]
MADDQALVRAGLRALLQQQGITVAFEVSDGAELVERLAAEPVDVVLSDIRMPGVDGIEALTRLRASGNGRPPSDLLLRAPARTRASRRRLLQQARALKAISASGLKSLPHGPRRRSGFSRDNRADQLSRTASAAAMPPFVGATSVATRPTRTRAPALRSIPGRVLSPGLLRAGRRH